MVSKTSIQCSSLSPLNKRSTFSKGKRQININNANKIISINKGKKRNKEILSIYRRKNSNSNCRIIGLYLMHKIKILTKCK
jgi:hypothetical protein